MAAHVHLVRHGHHPLLGRVLCGRMQGVQLDDEGCREMAEAAEIIRSFSPAVLQSSPQRRTMQSAGILAAACQCPIEIVSAINEVDFGQWTGATFEDLQADRQWQFWNEHRDVARAPDGESMGEAQTRAVRHLEQLRAEKRTFVIVSHAELIRAALMHYLGVPLRHFHTVEIGTASISTITFDKNGTKVSRVNGTVTA